MNNLGLKIEKSFMNANVGIQKLLQSLDVLKIKNLKHPKSKYHK